MIKREFKTGTFYNADCFDAMEEIQSGSIDMVLNDPPYGTVEGIGSETISHGMVGKTAWDIKLEPKEIFKAHNRILRMNGALVLFSQEPYTSHLVTEAITNLPFCYRMIWLKDHFANSLIAKKAPVSYYEDVNIFFKKYDLENIHPVRLYAKRILTETGKTLKQINSMLGHRKAEHFFYIDSTQFGLCTESVYEEITTYINLKKFSWFKPYAELKEINKHFERIFNLPSGQRFKSNVLRFRKDYGGLHPTQKPVALFEDLIYTYTNEGMTVLDNTAGSGTTAIAAINTNRRWICIERDPEYFEKACARVEEAEALL